MSVEATRANEAGTEAHLSARQLRQMAWITAVALGVFVFFRWLPTGTALSHMDFRVDAPNAIEFCDPSNPQFIPVVAVASPIAMNVKLASGATAGETVAATAILRTSGGKPIAPEDLVVVHTERLHLLIADPTLADYQHVHPRPGRVPGEWEFEFTPLKDGVYRIFADFTPAATNRGLYANADVNVGAGQQTISDGNASGGAASEYRFLLTPGTGTMKAGVPMDLRFEVTRVDGGPVPMEPVMDAYAHLVAFDETRSGFAHLHPMEADPAWRPDPMRPVLNFKITIPKAGRYVVWAQVNLGGQEKFLPFWFDVVEG